jgi:hypothetical protein
MAEVQKDRLTVGDRVIRDGKTQTLPKRRGVIVRAYASVPNGQGHSVPLFAVHWDDASDPNQIDVGYMDIDLALEPSVFIAPSTR